MCVFPYHQEGVKVLGLGQLGEDRDSTAAGLGLHEHLQVLVAAGHHPLALNR